MPTADPATTEQLETAQRLRIVFGRLLRKLRISDTAAGAEMTPARVSALLNIERNGPLRLTELAESEGLNPTMLSRIIADLVDAGLCERTSDPRDRRAAWVQVTAAGRAAAKRMRKLRTEAVQRALDQLTDAERQAIDQALGALESLSDALGRSET
jgi:DNA-binding MarR family transcriptional regulator